MMSTATQPASLKRAADADLDDIDRDHAADALTLLARGNVARALVLIIGHGLFENADFTRKALVELAPAARTPDTIKSFVEAGADLATGRWGNGAANTALVYGFSGLGTRGKRLSDDYILALLDHVDFESVILTQCCNMLARAMTAKPEDAPSAAVLEAIRARSNNTARWFPVCYLLEDLVKPHFVAQLPGTRIVLEGEDFTDRLHEVFNKHADRYTMEPALDALLDYCEKTGSGLGFLKDWCRTMKPLGQYPWLEKTMRTRAKELITDEWLDAANKFNPESNECAREYHARIVHTMMVTLGLEDENQ